MKFENGVDDKPYDPILTLLGNRDETLPTEFTEFGLDKTAIRDVPVRYIETTEGKVAVTTVYDLIMAQYGVGRGLTGDYPKDYTDKDAAYTPAWQEIFTGVDSKTVLQFAREWAHTAATTEGKCMIIIGAGINHWYHANLMYRAGAMALMLSGCVGKNGGGLNHYVGQEKLAPVDSWAAIAFAKDHVASSRLQQAPLWHYINTCQYRYDGHFSNYNTVPKNDWTKHAHRRHHLPVGAHGLDAVLPAVQAEHAGARSRSPGQGRRQDRRRASRRTRSRSSRARSSNTRSPIPTRPRTSRASGTSGAATPSPGA